MKRFSDLVVGNLVDGIDGQVFSPDFVFFRDRICGFKKDHPLAIVGAVLDCSWQGWKIGGIWIKVEHQSTRKAKWNVSEKMSEEIRRGRDQVEGVIGNLKSKKYGFNKPNVKSTVATELSGQRSFLGFNLSKALRKLNLQEMQIA